MLQGLLYRWDFCSLNIHPQTSTDLLHTRGENVFSVDLHFDAQGRPQVRALRNGPAHPHASGNIHNFERIEKAPATGIANHGMLARTVAVIRSQFFKVRDVLQLAVPVWRV